MFSSLRLSILLAMVGVAALVIATVAFFAGLATRAEFSRYIEFGRELRTEQMEQAVLTYVEEENAATTDEQIAYLEGLGFLTGSYDGRGTAPILRVDRLRFFPLNADPDDENAQSGEDIRFAVANDGEVQVMAGDQMIGTLQIDPGIEVQLAPAQTAFVESVNVALLLASALAALAAIAVTLVLSRRIIHPVAALTQAAERMERGDLSQRVHFSGRGEIAQLGGAFNSMAETLARNEKLRRNMVSDIAHELRTPMTNIRGYIEAVQDGIVEADSGTMELIYEEVMLMNRLIQDLQELALAEAGQLHMVRQPVELGDIITQSVTMLQPGAHRKQIELSADIPPNLPPVMADARRIAQIMRNLLDNALTYTPASGKVHVEAHAHEHEVEVRVIDSGEGIPEAHLPYLFERFYRVDPSRSRVTGGAGLGLAIVKQLIEAHGGRVQVESQIGAGTTFAFTLPLAPQRIPA